MTTCWRLFFPSAMGPGDQTQVSGMATKTTSLAHTGLSKEHKSSGN